MLPGELQKGDRLTADWVNQLVREAVSRTLNAGPGLRLARTPSGTTLSLARRRAAEPGMWRLSVADGRVTVGAGVWTDAGGAHQSPETDIGAVSSGLVVAALEDGSLSLSVRDTGDLPDTPFRVLGAISGGRAEQYESGPLAFDDAADAHWGETEPLTEVPADGPGAWNAMIEAGAGGEPAAVAESRLVDIDLDDDGRVTAKHFRTMTVDARGNVVAISERTENDPAPDPGSPDEGGDTPHCGHPLNEDPDDDHPLDGGGGGGGENGGEDDDHPLDHEGPGGFTPKCAD